MNRYKVFDKKVEKWAEILIDIIKDELVYYWIYIIETEFEVKKSKKKILGEANIVDSNIIIYYKTIKYATDYEYRSFKDAFKRYYFDRKIPNKEAYFRTIVVFTLIHELLHLSQYTPIKYRLRPSNNKHKYPYRYIGNKEHKIKEKILIENSVEFQTLYIFCKYRNELSNRLGIIKEGILPVYFYVIGAYDRKCRKIAEIDTKNEKYLKMHQKEILKNLYMQFKKFMNKNYRFSKYKKASEIYLSAYRTSHNTMVMIAEEELRENYKHKNFKFYNSLHSDYFYNYEQCRIDYYDIKKDKIAYRLRKDKEKEEK